MMVSMNASSPNFAAVQTNAKAAKVAQMQAQSNDVKMQADALETQVKAKSAKQHPQAKGVGERLNVQA